MFPPSSCSSLYLSLGTQHRWYYDYPNRMMNCGELPESNRRLPMNALRLVLTLVVGAALVRSTPDHYNMLLPDKASAAKGETVQFLYQWGHPSEHELFDAPAPEGVTVIAPDGKS